MIRLQQSCTSSPRLASPRLAGLMLALLFVGCAESSGVGPPLDAGTVVDLSAHAEGEIARVDPGQTSLPLCEERAINVHGPAGRPCAGMDSLCVRGVRDASDCCRPEARFPGTGCGEGMACDTGGECVPTTDVPREAASVVGSQSWLDVLGEGSPALITLEPTGLQVLSDNLPVADIHPNDGTTIDVSEVHLAHGRGRGFEAVAIAAPRTAIRRSVYLLSAPPTAEVCVVRGDFDTRGPVSADCNSPGSTRMHCPAGDADTVCDVFAEGGVRITGNDLAMVFELGTFGAQPAGADVRRALTLDSLDHRRRAPARHPSLTARAVTPDAPAVAAAFGFGCVPAQCSIGQIDLSTTCVGGRRACTALGCWGPWINPTEICDGRDNDCDGTIDENGTLMCDDGIGCTVDFCAISGGLVACQHTPWPTLCALVGDPYNQNCILPRCYVPPPSGFGGGTVTGPNQTWPTVGNITTAVDSRSCFYLQRNDYCTNTWDSCDCNAKETCAPGSNNMDATGCRNSQRMTGSAAGTGPNAWTGNYPCDADKKYCTFGLCCEPDVRCRDLELNYPDPTARQDAVSHCGQVKYNGVWLPPPPLRVQGRFSLPS